MPRAATGNAMTPAQRMKRYRERQRNEDITFSAQAFEARHIILNLRNFSGRKVEIYIPEFSSDHLEALQQLQEAIYELAANERLIQRMEQMEELERKGVVAASTRRKRNSSQGGTNNK